MCIRDRRAVRLSVGRGVRHGRQCNGQSGAPRAPVRLSVGRSVRHGHQCNGQCDCLLGAAFTTGTSATGSAT
eukprot:10268926-Alexandrium_andersonii.AAC.1